MIADVLVPLAAGVAIFLFGMKVMELALEQWAGPWLKRALETFTATPVHGLVAGTVLTALLQSSSAVTVVTIGLVNAGLLTFPRTLGIILGTNIGTCLTTELISLNISDLAIPLLVASSAIWLIGWLIPGRIMHAVRYPSLAVCGFSCLLAGMEVMQSIVPALQEKGLFSLFLEHAQKSALWGILAGAGLTAVIHSSAATIAMTMVLASMRAIDLGLGIAIVLGANVGTCATAVIAGIGGTKAGAMLARSHVLLNVCGAALFYPLIPALAATVEWMSADPSVQIARAQTVFNIACSLAALPVCYLPALRNLRFRS